MSVLPVSPESALAVALTCFEASPGQHLSVREAGRGAFYVFDVETPSALHWIGQVMFVEHTGTWSFYVPSTNTWAQAPSVAPSVEPSPPSVEDFIVQGLRFPDPGAAVDAAMRRGMFCWIDRSFSDGIDAGYVCADDLGSFPSALLKRVSWEAASPADVRQGYVWHAVVPAEVL